MKRNTTILTLLAATLAALPALGDLNYLKQGYKYIEKIPIRSISSNFNSFKTGNLTDDNNSTEWTSFEGVKELTFPETATYKDVTGEDIPDSNGNSELSVVDGLLTYARYPSDNPGNKGSRILTVTNSDLNLAAGMEYQVSVRLASNKAGSLTMQLGNQTAIATVAGTGEDEEVVFSFQPFAESVTAAQCSIDADLFSGSLDIKEANLLTPKPLASTYAGGWNTSTLRTIDGAITTNSGNLYAAQARHFTLASGISIVDGHDYKVEVRLKGSETGRSIINFGSWAGGTNNDIYIPISTEWATVEATIPSSFINKETDRVQLYCWDKEKTPIAYKGDIKVDWVKVYDTTSDSNTPIKEEYYNYDVDTQFKDWENGVNPKVVADAEGQNGKVLSAPRPPFHFAILDDISLDPATEYTVKITLADSRANESMYVNLGDYGNGRQYSKIITVEAANVMKTYTLNFETGTIPASPYRFCSIYSPNASGNISVQSVELYGGTQQTPLNFNATTLPAVAGEGWNQFTIAAGFNLEPNKDYLVCVRLRGTSAADVSCVLGATNPWGWSSMKSISIPGEFTDVQTVFTAADLTAVQNVDKLRLQVGSYVGKIEIEKVSIYAVAATGAATRAAGDQTRPLTYELNDGSAAGQGYTVPTLNADVLTAGSVPVTQKFYVFKDIELPAGNYKMTGEYSSQTGGTMTIQFGDPTDPSNWITTPCSVYMGYNNKIDTSIGSITAANGQTVKGDLIVELKGSGLDYFNGNFDLENVRISTDEVTVVDSWNYEGASEYTYYVSQNYKPYLCDDKLTFEHGWKRIRLLDNLSLKKGNKYKLIARLKGSIAGTVQMSLGGEKVDVDIDTDYKEWTRTFDFTDSKPMTQYCDVTRPSDYQGDLYVDYVGFEDTFSAGKAFNESGHNKLSDFTAKSELKDNELIVTPVDGNYEVVLISGTTGLKDETSYGVTARIVYSGTPSFQIKYGGLGGNLTENASVRIISEKDGVKEAELRAVLTREAIKEANPDDGFVMLLVNGHSANESLRIKSVRMWNPTEEFHGESKESDWNNWQAGRNPVIRAGGEELFGSMEPIVGQWERSVGFIIRDNISMKPGKKYSVIAKMRTSVHESSVGMRLGDWGANSYKANIVGTEWQEVRFDFDPLQISNGFLRLTIFDDFAGTLEVQDMRIECDESENTIDYTALTSNPNPEVAGSGYPAPSVGTNDNGSKALLVRYWYKPFKVTKQLKFNPRYNYTVTADVTVAKAGQLNVSLANDSFSETFATPQLAANTKTTISVGPFPAVTANDGFLVMQALSDLGDVQVSNVQIHYTVPEANNQPLTSDYFDVQLGVPLAKEGLYRFHIGYSVDAANAPMPETPVRFLVQGKQTSQGDDAYVNLGQYTLTPNSSDADGRGHMFFDTYDVPLSVAQDNTIDMLRFICTDNYGHVTGIVEDGDDYATGSLIRMTRFAVYKQSEFLNGTSAQTDNWVVPLLTRFQIEAMGQKYAYPGPRLRDMIDVAKNYNNTGTLFDGDQSNENPYWDTTVPYNKEEGSSEDGGQNRDYAEDCITSDLDYIDILLPQLKGTVKKYNGVASTDENAGNQVVIVLQRGNNSNVNADNDLRTYPDLEAIQGQREADPFINKANGFPLEIRYQGIKKGGNSISHIADNNVDDGVAVLNFPVIAAGDSIRFALDVKEGWDGIRLYCRENTGRTERIYGKKKVTKNYKDTKGRNLERITDLQTVPGTRIMRFAKIRAYMEIPKIDLESADGRADYDKLYNHREDFEHYDWKHTQGIIDDINNPPFEGDTRYMKFAQTESGEKKTWQDVMETFKSFFDERGLAYPDFSYLNNPFDDDDVVPSNGPQRVFSNYAYKEGASGGLNVGPRQRTYTVLHEVYALPGERVDLYPYSDIWNNQTGFNYEDQFVRWYDYLTDRAPDYLYFFSEPKSAIKTDRGFIAGKTLLDHGYRGKGSVASVYFNKAGANDDWSYIDTDGRQKMKDQWVAADFSLTFNTNLAGRLGKDGDTWQKKEQAITEPIVTFRHIFHIQSASIFADKYMGDYNGNKTYVNSNRRYISTFADKSFKIRLEQAMPLDADTKSPFYYKETVDGTDEYHHVRGYEIMTYYLENDDPDKLYDESHYVLTGERDSDIATLKANSIFSTVKGEELRMFEPDDQPFMHLDSYVETTVAPRDWRRDNKEFARSIQCRKSDAKKGKYLVRIYGKDLDGHIIRLKDDEGKYWPLVIAEYEVEFLDDTRASFVPEEDIPEINATPGHKYYSHMERYLERRFGASTDAKAVNFDQYMILKQDAVDIDGTTVDFNRFGFFENKTGGMLGSRLKLPITWGNSNYGFGYTTQGDYNMFRLADHSTMTPYKNAADARRDNPYDAELKITQKGTYDRLFYNSGGKEKGLFYYVNAASDPGEMVKIDFDYLCPGSTIYVSAWVNEFNDGQPETANVIFNFYGNVARKSTTAAQSETETRASDGDSSSAERVKIIRSEQLHGFATGYVKRNPEDDYENGGNSGGDQGKWMHVYYSFVPDKSHADLEADEEIVSYSLVLENNCVSSAGADYAIDDIRAYVVSPRVEAEQKGALCEKDDRNIDIEVRMPFETLRQSLIGQEDNNDHGVVKLQYSIIDKTKYDDSLEETLAGKAEGYKLQTDDFYEAFAAGVLHYPHDNNESADAEVKKKPLSWGTIDFYPNYLNQKDEMISVGGKDVSIYDYMMSHIDEVDGEMCFTFITHPVANDGQSYNEFEKTHRNYYVIVDHLGTTSIFTDVEGASYGEGQTNADIYPAVDDKANWASYDKDLAKAFQICTDCARMAEFTLKSAAQIVIDGVLHEDGENITCCENQRPSIQLNLKTKKTRAAQVLSDDYEVVDGNAASENPYLDWWTGPFEEFAETHKTIDGSDKDLWDVLDCFRTDYPGASTWNMPTVAERKEGETKPEKYTDAMRTWLKELCADTKLNEAGVTVPVEPKLILHQSSYVFPQSKTVLGKDEDWKDIYVTAIPPATPTEITGADGVTYVICTQPREVKITVSNTSPTLLNGFSEIEYPEVIEDVPLRVGLKQLDYVVDGTTSNELYVPLRNMSPATDDVTSFLTIKEQRDDEAGKVVREANEYVYLIETNDPAYRQISDYVPDNKRTDDVYNVDTRIAGTVQNITVKFSKVGDEFKATETPMARIVFYKEPEQVAGNGLPRGMTFREGYYYKFKFNFEEASSPSMEAAGYEEKCHGQTVFTIKVVPEYQVWTGDASLNWNNDDNWRRVSSSELLADAAKDRFTTDGSNSREFSYAPLDFTKVVIPAGATYPHLASRAQDRTGTGTGIGYTTVNNGKESKGYVWAAESPKAVNPDDYKNSESNVDSKTNASVYIQYDMAAVTYDNSQLTTDNSQLTTDNSDHNVYCRPWYANACEQIHFDSNAEILNQQHLDYRKAWVDMEMKPHRWYNVASPLYGVVAGDMYLPKADGRQNTELFTDIKYDVDLNDRFAPAVYQRGWDKGTETVYTVHNTSTEDTESVALASTWSHVYNDVTEVYTPGMGVSVMTDVTRLANLYETKDTEGNAVAASQSLVKFRFPKADESYNYFEDGKLTEDGKPDPGESNHKPLTRTNKGRLFDPSTEQSSTVLLSKKNAGKLFLVGNPFMAHLDMAEFLKENSGVIEPKYWLLTEENQTAVVLDHNKELLLSAEAGTITSGGFSVANSTAGLLPPMQGFFVQAKTAGTSLSVKFTPEMTAVESYDDSKGHLLKAPAAPTRAEGDDIIRVSTPESAAIIRLNPSADKGYAANEDAELIDDSNQRSLRRVYTVAGTIASAINQTPDADGVEVGLMAPTDSVTTVTFSGLVLEDYLLYDTATGEKTQLYDGFELEMTGSVSGRYFLTSGVSTVEIDDSSIRIRPEGSEVVVTAPAVCGSLTVRVFDTLGREIAKAEGFAEEVRIPVDPGIYAVEAVGSAAGRHSTKLSIR